jgi:starch synthase
MVDDLSCPEALSFHIPIAAADYRALNVLLRSASKKTPRPKARPACSTPLREKQVYATIDLSTSSPHLLVTEIDSHKLPQPISLRPGSRSYTTLARSISDNLNEGDSNGIKQLLEEIASSCPDNLSTETLIIIAADLEIAEDNLTPKERRIRTNSKNQKKTRRILSKTAPTILIDTDDAPTLIISEPLAPEEYLKNYSDVNLAQQDSAPGADTTTISQIRESFSATLSQTEDGAVLIQGSFLLMQTREDITPIKLFAHWGSYDEISPPWRNKEAELITLKDSLSNRQHTQYRFNLELPKNEICLNEPGDYGVAFFVTINNQRSEAAWLGKPRIDDLHFAIARSRNESLNSYLKACLTKKPSNPTIHNLADDLGEVIFATPEGPHAAAGGLAHVISGLPKELTKLGLAVTIITPLYARSNGNKHPAARSILQNGFILGETRVIPRYVTTISVTLGSNLKRECKIYAAEDDNLRVILIANSDSFDRLYQPVPADEQLRRAILFSRATLEAIATPDLDLRPRIILSNDWMTAPIPSLFRLDARYRSLPWLSETQTVHIIHNGGADYHGRLPVSFGENDLWPLLSLAPEHYFGFKDPHRDDLINLTLAAARHSTGGVITVSEPYAQHLLEPGGGDGLDLVLTERPDQVYGVSNGINRGDIDSFLVSRLKLSANQLLDESELLRAKQGLLSEIQTAHALNLDSDALLISFVARLAEQKGLDLISGSVNHYQHSTLESLLLHHPRLQIIIAGPVTHNDEAASRLIANASELARRYPGRIALRLEYIAHQTALEIMTASSLFMMPSRFEPGGITQLESLAVGTPVVARNVGGIAATLRNYNPQSGAGDSFLCNDYYPKAYADTMHWALNVISDPNNKLNLSRQARRARHSWSDRAPKFLQVLREVAGGKR